MFKAEGCHKTLCDFFASDLRANSDEDIQIFGIDAAFEVLKLYVLHCQIVDEGYEGDTEEENSFDSGHTPNDTKDPNYIPEEPTSIAQFEFVEVFVPEPVEPELILISDSDDYTPPLNH